MGWVHRVKPLERDAAPFSRLPLRRRRITSSEPDNTARAPFRAPASESLRCKCLTMCLSHEDLVAELVVLWAYGRSIYDGRSAPTVRSDATRSSWLSKLHERKEKPIERTSRARSGAGR